MTTSNNFTIDKPKLIFPRLVYEKINHMVQKGGSHECSGLGVTRLVGNKIYVDDIIMVKQRNSGGTTDMEADAVAKAMYHFRNHEGVMNFWWHSHADMGVFWSGTDSATINQIGQGGMCVAAVFNKKREVKAAVSCLIETPFSETPVSLFLDDIPVSAETQIPEEMKTAWDAEYDDSVEKKTYHYSGTSAYGGGGTSQMGFRETSRETSLVHSGRGGGMVSEEDWSGFGADDYEPLHRSGGTVLTGDSKPSNPTSSFSSVPGSPSALTDAFNKKAREFAKNNQEIRLFSTVSSSFLLEGGQYVDAEEYMAEWEKIEAELREIHDQSPRETRT